MTEGADGAMIVVVSALVVMAAAGVMLWCWRLRLVDVGARQQASADATDVDLRRLLDEIPEALVLVDAAGVVQTANAASLRLFDMLPDHDATPPGMLIRSMLIGQNVLKVVPEEVSELFESILARGETGRAVRVEMPTRDGGRLVDVSCFSADPSSGRFMLRFNDITEREQADRALAQAQARFRQAFRSAPTGMALVRVQDGRIIDANKALASMLSINVHKLIGCTLREFTHPEDTKIAQTQRAQLELGIIDEYNIEQRLQRYDGDFVWVRTRVAVVSNQGTPLAITHIENITEERRTAERLRHAAWHDQLTGLANRAFLMKSLAARLEHAVPDELGVFFIDIDNFKHINDSLGHQFGDEVIKIVAGRLSEVITGDDVLARFGGDEFVVVSTEPVAELAERLRNAVQPPVLVGEHELFVTASVGYTSNYEAGAHANDLLRDADAGMYRAKDQGRNRTGTIEFGGHEKGVRSLRLASQLRHGINRGEIVPYFQPLVDLYSGEVVGHEVLVRWLHPERGLLLPEDFLGLAEETGLIVAMGSRVLRDALMQLARWQTGGTTEGQKKISVNVAMQQLADPNFPEIVSDALLQTGVDPDKLYLEITESTLLSDVKNAELMLQELRSMGLHLAVDDFGTGYSSLTYLKRFPVEAIKIDRIFVDGLGVESDDNTIVDAVIKLGQAMNLNVIAEGVESELQLDRLRRLGCDLGQGYLFGRPRPAHLLEHAYDTIGDPVRAGLML